MCVHIHIHIYIYMHIQTFLYININTDMYIYIHMYIYTYIHTNTHQVMDTPGLLDRPVEDRNEMEKLTFASLAHLPTAVIFVIDPTGVTCSLLYTCDTFIL
jgi:hypothetical protein